MSEELKSVNLKPVTFTVNVERVVKLRDYETERISFGATYPGDQCTPKQAYEYVSDIVNKWAVEVVFKVQAIKREVENMLPGPSGKLDKLMDAIKPYADRVTVTESPTTLNVRTRGRLEREAWGDLNTIIRGQGGSWKGTKDGVAGKEVHWEIPK
jgi:hypothetical protein